MKPIDENRNKAVLTTRYVVKIIRLLLLLSMMKMATGSFWVQKK